jgi:hypothetical protein
VEAHLPGMLKALGLTPSTTKEKRICKLKKEETYVEW